MCSSDLGPCVIESIKKVSPVPLDVHLMISEPERYLESFVRAGSDWITFHLETVPDPKATIAKVKSLGARAGISVKPATPIAPLQELLPSLDLVLVMSVEPGFGGQKFMPEALEKARFLREKGFHAISMDGGINLQTAPMAIEAGVTILVAGSAIFHTPDPGATVKAFRRLYGQA